MPWICVLYGFPTLLGRPPQLRRGSPRKNFNREKLKIWPKIQPVRLNNFRASGGILTGLFSVDATRSNGDKLGTIFTMPAQKTSKIFRDFRQFSTLIANNSSKDQYIKNRKCSRSSTTPPTLCGKKLGVLRSTNEKVIDSNESTPQWTFSRDYISALRGSCAPKFLHTLEIDQGLLALTRRWTPPQKKIAKI